jgi:hypothetical protein
MEAIKVWSTDTTAIQSVERLKRAAVHLASVFMYKFGLRFGNVGDSDNKGKHAIRRRDVVFEDLSGRRFNIPQYASFLKSVGCWTCRKSVKERVICVVVFIHSSKVWRKIGRIKVIGRRNGHEAAFLEVDSI